MSLAVLFVLSALYLVVACAIWFGVPFLVYNRLSARYHWETWSHGDTTFGEGAFMVGAYAWMIVIGGGLGVLGYLLLQAAGVDTA